VSDMLKKQGILIGRPGQGHLMYNWGVVPPESDVDILESDLPTELFQETLVINSKRARRIPKNLYIVEYIRRDVLSSNKSSLPIADISGVKEKISLDNLSEQVKKIDPLAELTTFSGEAEIDEKFILDLSTALGTGAKLPKRFYSTQIVLKVKEDGEKRDKTHTIMMPFAEVIAFLQDNPSYVKGLVVLPTYHFGILLTDNEIPMEVFKTEILDQITTSLQVFKNMTDKTSLESKERGTFEE